MSTESADAAGARPNPERARLARAFTQPLTLELVAEGIALASTFVPLIYVERRGALYRWSPAHRGGPYPLLRVTAKFIGVDHHSLVLPFRALEGLCVIRADERESRPTNDWTLLEFDGPATAAAVKSRILTLLPDTKSSTKAGQVH